MQPTAMGKGVRHAYRPTIEKDWRERLGDDVVDELRGALEAIVAQVDADDQLPHLLSLSTLWSDGRWSSARR